MTIWMDAAIGSEKIKIISGIPTGGVGADSNRRKTLDADAPGVKMAPNDINHI